MIRVMLYSRPYCHLCEAVEAGIEAMSRRLELELVVVNILDDGQLYERYKHDIPVVCVAGKEVCRHVLDAAALERAVESVGST